MALDNELHDHGLAVEVDSDGVLDISPQLIEGIALGVDGLFHGAGPPAVGGAVSNYLHCAHSVWIIPDGS
ncbi:MAG: hypothetical protein QXS96_08550 [Candidatus Caldarchaeum sp.]